MDPIAQLAADAAQSMGDLQRSYVLHRPLNAIDFNTGLQGEFAFGQMFNVFPDMSLKKNGDGGFDFVIPLLFKIDVKTSKWRNGALDMKVEVKNGKPLRADIYVFAIISEDGSKCECVGWQWKAYVEKKPLTDLGTGVINHLVPQAELKPMSELLSRKLMFGDR